MGGRLGLLARGPSHVIRTDLQSIDQSCRRNEASIKPRKDWVWGTRTLPRVAVPPPNSVRTEAPHPLCLHIWLSNHIFQYPRNESVIRRATGSSEFCAVP